MAVLSAADRLAVRDQWMRDNTITCSVTKADLLAAFAAADQWCEDNAASYNLAIPQPARNALTARQKAWILAAVVLKRFNVI